ncbi:MAG: hypothetical protein ALAOOOJD_03968 [bacterium]|nr:hypothetical protein [bacterium]
MEILEHADDLPALRISIAGSDKSAEGGFQVISFHRGLVDNINKIRIRRKRFGKIAAFKKFEAVHRREIVPDENVRQRHFFAFDYFFEEE